jgi:hypothetical protein
LVIRLINIIGITGRLVAVEGPHGARVGHVELKGEGEVLVFFGPVKPPANLGIVILIVAGAAWDLYLGYVCVFGPVCRPLDNSS